MVQLNRDASPAIIKLYIGHHTLPVTSSDGRETRQSPNGTRRAAHTAISAHHTWLNVDVELGSTFAA